MKIKNTEIANIKLDNLTPIDNDKTTEIKIKFLLPEWKSKQLKIRKIIQVIVNYREPLIK